MMKRIRMERKRMERKINLRALLLLPVLLVLLFAGAARADVLITEVMASNGVYENGEAFDWVELTNTDKKAVDISGWYLSDSKKNPLKWQFPKGTKLKGGASLTVFCTGEEGHAAGKGSTFYTGFKISSSGETLILSDAEGTEHQRVKVPEAYGNVSWGLAAGGSPEDGAAWGFFENATRGKKNEKQVFAARAKMPEVVTPAGFYEDSVTVQVRGEEGAQLRYTLDGETPTAKSPLFPEEGLTLKETTPLRVKAFREGYVSSETAGATYFLNDPPQTAIVSLIADERYLFDSRTGMLVKGSGSFPNYERDWEYPVHIEYFTKEGENQISQTGTMTVSGHSSRINAQKSIALYARKSWGAETFAFNPFPTRDYTGYKSLLLRAANSDAYATRIRDVVATSLAEGQGILYQDAVVIQVYINGKYWGHYNLREKVNKYFFAQYEGITDEEEIDRIDILDRTGTDEFTRNGHNADWLALCDFCKKNDLNIPENLARVEAELDIDTLFTHAAYQIILGNVDFTNVRFYRVPGGKWKHMLFDVEASWRNDDPTPIEYYIKPVNAKVNGFRHEPLNALLAVPEYKAKFLNRVSGLLAEVFRWDRMEQAFDRMINQLEPILPRHISRWKNMKLENWHKNIKAIKYYARVRPKQIPGMLKKAMKLTDDEVEQYFGDTLRLLEETNRRPES